jgi:glycosyltransferase involved in cell wall biosynthesis
MKIAVLVATYRRPLYLAQCLRALERQRRKADQVLVIVRDSDAKTRELFDRCSFRLPLRIVVLDVRGHVAALKAGLDRVEGDVIAITDDDATPHTEWLSLVEQHFERDPVPAGDGWRNCLRDGTGFLGVRTLLLSRRLETGGSRNGSPKHVTANDLPRAGWAAEVTISELLAELEKMPPHAVACVADEQGFPYEIAAIRYSAERDTVTIDSRWPQSTTSAQ